MITINKVSENSYYVVFQKYMNEIDQQAGHQLKKEVGQIMNSGRTIQINFKNVGSVNNNGLKMLNQLIELGSKRHCTVNFINMKSSISNQLEPNHEY